MLINTCKYTFTDKSGFSNIDTINHHAANIIRMWWIRHSNILIGSANLRQANYFEDDTTFVDNDESKNSEINPEITSLQNILSNFWSRTHCLFGSTYDELITTIQASRDITIKKKEGYFIAKYKDNCSVWNEATMVSRGLAFNASKKTFSFPLVKFFSFNQLRTRPSGEYQVYVKYDGSAIYIWDGIVFTLGSTCSTQVDMVNKHLGVDVVAAFPSDWTIFGEYVDGINDSKVERISGPPRFIVTYGYDSDGNGYFPEEIKYKKILPTIPTIEYATGVTMNADDIMIRLADMDQKAIKSGMIEDVKEGLVLWKNNIPYKLKSHLYLDISKLKRPVNFLKPMKKKKVKYSKRKVDMLEHIDTILKPDNIHLDIIKTMFTREFDNEIEKIVKKANDEYIIFKKNIDAVIDSLKTTVKSITTFTCLSDMKRYFGETIKLNDNTTRVSNVLSKYMRNIGSVPFNQITYHYFMP
jgi:hypothetical protein